VIEAQCARSWSLAITYISTMSGRSYSTVGILRLGRFWYTLEAATPVPRSCT